MTWTEAMGECKEKGGNLVESYPVVSEQLKALTHAKVKASKSQITDLQICKKFMQEFILHKTKQLLRYIFYELVIRSKL